MCWWTSGRSTPAARSDGHRVRCHAWLRDQWVDTGCPAPTPEISTSASISTASRRGAPPCRGRTGVAAAVRTEQLENQVREAVDDQREPVEGRRGIGPIPKDAQPSRDPIEPRQARVSGWPESRGRSLAPPHGPARGSTPPPPCPAAPRSSHRPSERCGRRRRRDCRAPAPMRRAAPHPAAPCSGCGSEKPRASSFVSIDISIRVPWSKPACADDSEQGQSYPAPPSSQARRQIRSPFNRRSRSGCHPGRRRGAASRGS